MAGMPGLRERGGISDKVLWMYNVISQRFNFCGFLLIEVMVTLLLLSIVLIALARFQVMALQDNSLAKSRTIAVNLAQNKIETLRNIMDTLSYDAVGSGSDSVGPPGSSATKTLTGLNTTYTRSWSVFSGATLHDMQLEVLVTWPDLNGVEDTATRIKLTSDISNISSASSGKLF